MAKPILYDLKEHDYMEGKQNGRMQVIQASPNCTIQYCQIRQPHDVGPHSHDYEQIVFIPEGECVFWVDGVPYELDQGCFCVVPPGAVHYLEAKSNMYCVDFDIFHPKREDRKETPRVRDRHHANWEPLEEAAEE